MTEEVKRGRGRPKTLTNPESFTLEMEKDHKEFLKLLAKEADMGLAAYFRDILGDYVEEWKEMRPDLVIEGRQEEKNV